MKLFYPLEVREATVHAADGGQALHVHEIIVDEDAAPRCFVQALQRGEWIAHLLDQDIHRLRDTVRRLGVRVVVVEHEGKPWQHVDLCAGPLKACLRFLSATDAAVLRGGPAALVQ